MKGVENKVRIRIGTAGWSIPKISRGEFRQAGSVLQQYASRLDAVEINSSFYRSHKRSTYEKWASQVPQDFSFSVKLPRTITHHSKLHNIDTLLDEFADEVSGLGSKLGFVLVQLPPSLEFSRKSVQAAFTLLRKAFACAIVCEPRHRSWFSNEVDQFLIDAGVSRAAADPALCPQALVPGGAQQTCYYRLHGSPKIYYSEYSDNQLKDYADLISDHHQSSEVWCIFDNTASGHAMTNALKMPRLLRK